MTQIDATRMARHLVGKPGATPILSIACCAFDGDCTGSPTVTATWSCAGVAGGVAVAMVWSIGRLLTKEYGEWRVVARWHDSPVIWENKTKAPESKTRPRTHVLDWPWILGQTIGSQAARFPERLVGRLARGNMVSNTQPAAAACRLGGLVVSWQGAGAQTGRERDEVRRAPGS
eukprot:scaffold2802_cov110-Isochrysis_galbana.AAC.2